MVEDNIEYEFKCPDCNWNIPADEIKRKTGFKEQILFCELCGARLKKYFINEFEEKIEIEQISDKNSKLFPVEIIATDSDFTPGFIDDLTLVLSRMIYVNIRMLEKLQNENIKTIKFDETLLNYIADTIIPILDKEINLLFLKSLQNLNQEDFGINLKNLQSKLANINTYCQYFIIYLRWLIKEVFTIVSELWNKKKLEVFDETIINDLKGYNFEEIYLLLENPPQNQSSPKDASHSLLTYLNDFFSKFPEEISNYKNIEQLALEYLLEKDAITDLIIGYLSDIYENAMVMDIYNLLWVGESDKILQLINCLSSQLKKYPEYIDDIDSARQLAIKNGFGTAGSRRDHVRGIIKQYLRIRYGLEDAEFMYNEIWGARCKQTKALDYDKLDEIIKDKGAKLLTTREEYDNMAEPPVLRIISIEHVTIKNREHRFDMRINNFLYRDSWCPICSNFYKTMFPVSDGIQKNMKNFDKLTHYDSLKEYIQICDDLPLEVLKNQGERISHFANQFTNVNSQAKRTFINQLVKSEIKYFKKDDKNIHHALFQLIDFSMDKHYIPSQIYHNHGSADHTSVLSKILLDSDYAIATEIPIYRKYSDEFLTGHIDLLMIIDDILYVCDYKPRTSPHPNANPSVSFINSIPQIACYGLILKKNYGINKLFCVTFNKLGIWLYEPEIVMQKITSFIKKQDSKRKLTWENFFQF